MKKYTCDFETTVDNITETRVWAYSICEIGNFDNFIYGTSIDDFIKWCSGRDNPICFFHNLKFDGTFIMNYLFKNGFTWIKDKKDAKDKTFTTLITDMGQFYCIEVYFTKTAKHTNKVSFYDSLKILNFSVDAIAKDFDLPIRKLKIDYEAHREIDHKLTKEEIDYIRNDVEIMARALDFIFKENLTKITIASDALAFYKTTVNFSNYFPELNPIVDEKIRASYKGGFTYLNPIYKQKLVNDGLVLDVNSLYPSVLRYEKLPIGEPLYFDGKYETDKLYNLYVQTITCCFKLKKNKIPSLQIKNNLFYKPNEYLETSVVFNKGEEIDEPITLTLTNIDLELFFEQYDVYDLSYNGGYKFKSINGLFNKYVDYWTEKKISSKKEHNKSMYKLSKLMLNSLYGRFGLNPHSTLKEPYYDTENGIVKYKYQEPEYRSPVYIPVATFVTSYARRKTILTSQAIRDFTLANLGKDYYIYSDTDSIHMLKLDDEIIKSFVDVDDYRLGAWKIESRFTRAKFLRQKCYIEELDDELNMTVAGLPKRLSSLVNFNNFDIGLSIPKEIQEKNKQKLTYKNIRGGVILVPTDFSIK